MTFDSPKTSVVLWYPCEGLAPGPPADTKFHGCSSPLYKIVQNNAYSWPFVDSQAQVEILFLISSWSNLKMRNPVIQRADYIFIGEKYACKWICEVQTHFVQVSTVYMRRFITGIGSCC